MPKLCYESIGTFLCMLMLGISAVTDIRRREIPITLCAICAVISCIFHCYYQTGWMEYVAASAFFLILYFIQAIFFTGSGGDIILMASFGLIEGVPGSLVAVVISGVALTIYVLMRRRRASDEVPLAPFVLIGYILYFLLKQTGMLDTYIRYVHLIFKGAIL